MGDSTPGKYGAVLCDPRNGSGGGISKVANIIEGAIEDVGNGWFRCWAAMPFSLASSILVIELRGQDGKFPYRGDGHSGMLIWGAQFERSSRPSTLHSDNHCSAYRGQLKFRNASSRIRSGNVVRCHFIVLIYYPKPPLRNPRHRPRDYKSTRQLCFNRHCLDETIVSSLFDLTSSVIQPPGFSTKVKAIGYQPKGRRTADSSATAELCPIEPARHRTRRSAAIEQLS